MHLAYMELRYCTAMFFRQCKGARLAKEMTALNDDALENYFVITPKEKKLIVDLSPMKSKISDLKGHERKDSMMS